MSESETPAPAMVLTRIVIERRLLPDGEDVINYNAVDSGGDFPTLIEQLGLLALGVDCAKDIAMRDENDDE